MGNRKGHSEAQSFDEMVADMNEAKEKGLNVHRGQSIYKKESGEYQEDKLRELVSCHIADVVEYATKERVALEDLEEVQKRTVIYLRACEESGTFPSSLGLARSLGYSDRALRHWRSKQPNTKTAQWLEMFNDTCADILAQSALKNNANNIMAIFLNKALYDFRETSELVLTPNNNGAIDDSDYSVDDIKSRYALAQKDNSEEG
ncbi:MAG: hypothetical protein PUH30_10255 [Oscillospiraceae bacterium]|nr:hypothetical protein [Oscillospiraceae bacterium]